MVPRATLEVTQAAGTLVLDCCSSMCKGSFAEIYAPHTARLDKQMTGRWNAILMAPGCTPMCHLAAGTWVLEGCSFTCKGFLAEMLCRSGNGNGNQWD